MKILIELAKRVIIKNNAQISTFYTECFIMNKNAGVLSTSLLTLCKMTLCVMLYADLCDCIIQMEVGCFISLTDVNKTTSCFVCPHCQVVLCINLSMHECLHCKNGHTTLCDPTVRHHVRLSVWMRLCLCVCAAAVLSSS